MWKNFQEATLGKKLGFIAFFLTEFIIITTVVLSLTMSKEVDINYNEIISYQFFTFLTVWGAKASAKWAEKFKVKDAE